MSTRGPDGAGIWFAPGARTGLAHRRLSIIDLSDSAAQPMHSMSQRHTIVFNGEIYNFLALRAGLEAQGHRFRTRSDTEVLLLLYELHKEAMLPMLRGMFALAIWDADRDSLFLARDPYGIKPLYYADTGGCFRFASQVKALLTDGAISRDPSPAGLTGFHLFGAIPEPFTLYRDIRACPAGSWLRVDARGVGAPVPYASIAGAIASARPDKPRNLRDHFLESVRHHLVADVEVGAFLSGGVDSSALIGLMRDCGQERITACTLGFAEFAGQGNDEVPRARDIAALYGVEHHVRMVDAAEFAGDLDAIFDAMDQPSIDGINTWFISKACKELGLKVALSGIGGDELLAGYSTFSTVPQMHRLAGSVARLPFSDQLGRMLLRTVAPGLVKRNPKVEGVLALSRSWAGAYLLRRAVLLPFQLGEALDPEMAQAGLEELRPLESIAATIKPDPGSDVGRVCTLESANYMRNQLLRDADWAGMAHSLEIRVPLVDFTLLQQIAPYLAGISGGTGKALLARAPSIPVPPAIVKRSKTGFSIPISEWIRHETSHVEDRRASRDWAMQAIDRYRQSVAALPLG